MSGKKGLVPQTEKLNVRIRVGYKDKFLKMVEQWKVDNEIENRKYTEKTAT